MARSRTTTARAPAHRRRSRLVDPAALMRIQSLELRARTVVDGFLSGLHRSLSHGFSVEFTEYRPYTTGDDLRYLDWRLFARTDRYCIKRFEDETNLRCYLLLDVSRSMAFGSVGYDKAAYAATLAATLGWFLLRQRDAVGAAVFDADLVSLVPARNRTGQWQRLLHAIDRPADGTSTQPGHALPQVAEHFCKRGLVVLLSDLLADLDGIESGIRQLAGRGHEVVVVQILDPAEKTFSFEQPAWFEDLETGRRLHADPRIAAESYRERLDAHVTAVRETTERLGGAFHAVTTDEPLEQMLAEFLRSRIKRTVRRIGHARSRRRAVA